MSRPEVKGWAHFYEESDEWRLSFLNSRPDEIIQGVKWYPVHVLVPREESPEPIEGEVQGQLEIHFDSHSYYERIRASFVGFLAEPVVNGNDVYLLNLEQCLEGRLREIRAELARLIESGS